MSRGTLLVSLLAVGCGSSEGPPADAGLLPSTYEDVEPIIRTSCTFSGACHGGDREGQAQLNFAAALDSGDFRTALEGPACEYRALPLLTPGDPDRSWLFIKVAGMADPSGLLQFEPDPSWDPGIEPDEMGQFPSSQCPLVVDGAISFGEVMPQSGGTARLDDERMAILRAWIEAGAPGPVGG